MASEEHLQIMRQGVDAWNDWRQKNSDIKVNLREANLREANLWGADLWGADLWMADLEGAKLGGAGLAWAELWMADLRRADLRGAHLQRAQLHQAILQGANLWGADLSGANLWGADLQEVNLQEANLEKANLNGAQLIRSDLRNAKLTGSYVYGVSAWDIQVDERTEQQNLIITDSERDEPVITVDNIKVAQFIYLLLNNQEIRDVIDTITSKAVLILGRFSEERKPVLDAIRDQLRKPEHNYLPVMFDFTPAVNQPTLGTIKTLASMARFVIADLTDARAVLQELQAVVPAFPSVAVRLMIKKSQHEYGMLDEIRLFRSVVEDTYEYEDTDEVIASIWENIIAPAEAKVGELRRLIRPAMR
jgi:Pentapeptide repeats (8 copies)